MLEFEISKFNEWRLRFDMRVEFEDCVIISEFMSKVLFLLKL